jgi:hypothetical protein
MEGFQQLITRMAFPLLSLGEFGRSPKLYGFIDDDPWFGSGPDLYIYNNCNRREYFSSRLGGFYGGAPDIDEYAWFGKERFRAVDYEVFKIVIE